MFPKTQDEWLKVLLLCGVRGTTANRWAPVFGETITPDSFSAGEKDLADFLPTVLHESGMLERLEEDGRYSAKRIRDLGNASAPGSRWRSLVPRADELAGNPEKFFEAVYGDRLGNGPEGTGDGALYRGRGLIMLTGKANYAWQGKRSGQDLLEVPDLAAQPHFALEFAVSWWEGKVPDVMLGDSAGIRRIVNGGTFGLSEVQALVDRTQGALA